jgi:hypothetical protein
MSIGAVPVPHSSCSWRSEERAQPEKLCDEEYRSCGMPARAARARMPCLEPRPREGPALKQQKPSEPTGGYTQITVVELCQARCGFARCGGIVCLFFRPDRTFC